MENKVTLFSWLFQWFTIDPMLGDPNWEVIALNRMKMRFYQSKTGIHFVAISIFKSKQPAAAKERDKTLMKIIHSSHIRNALASFYAKRASSLSWNVTRETSTVITSLSSLTTFSFPNCGKSCCSQSRLTSDIKIHNQRTQR